MKLPNTTLLNINIGSAVSALTTTPMWLSVAELRVASLGLYANFVYGSGGTSVDAWIQTSLDYNNNATPTWIDVANFHFTTSSAKAFFNLTSTTIVTTQVTTFTDGSLTANTSVDGTIGALYRVKYTSVGTYAGGTTLRIDGVARF